MSLSDVKILKRGVALEVEKHYDGWNSVLGMMQSP
jgi:hypothetical protein